jgi:hypothetical protein
LATLGTHPDRPRLLVGFAAETQDVVANASAKRAAKNADWIVANDVSGDVMGGARNRVHLITAGGVEDWPEAAKEDVARTSLRALPRSCHDHPHRHHAPAAWRGPSAARLCHPRAPPDGCRRGRGRRSRPGPAPRGRDRL